MGDSIKSVLVFFSICIFCSFCYSAVGDSPETEYTNMMIEALAVKIPAELVYENGQSEILQNNDSLDLMKVIWAMETSEEAEVVGRIAVDIAEDAKGYARLEETISVGIDKIVKSKGPDEYSIREYKDMVDYIQLNVRIHNYQPNTNTVTAAIDYQQQDSEIISYRDEQVFSRNEISWDEAFYLEIGTPVIAGVSYQNGIINVLVIKASLK